MNENGFTQFSTITVLLLLAAFYGGTYLLTLLIRKEKEDTSGFMVAGHHVGFGMGAASMTATWIRASVFTDFAQLVALMAIAIIIIPAVLYSAGGPSVMVEGLSKMTDEQANLFSVEAIMNQGAPFFVAVLAYAIGNQTISQRLFAVREKNIKSTFVTATIGYGAIVIGLGMIGLMALSVGVEPIDGKMNNLIPQMVSTYLSPFFVALFFILVIGSLSSTADSDLSALSTIMMADVYGKNIAKDNPNPKVMMLVGRITMIVATVAGLIFASFSLDILVMLVFVGALWGAIVFPVIVSCYWDRVTNSAFTWSVVVAMALFCIARFELLEMTGMTVLAFEVLASVGGAVVIGMMVFGFFGRAAGLVAGAITLVAMLMFATGFLRDYMVLVASLTAYGASAVVCTAMTLLSKEERFDFDLIKKRVGDYDDADSEETAGLIPEGAK